MIQLVKIRLKSITNLDTTAKSIALKCQRESNEMVSVETVKK